MIAPATLLTLLAAQDAGLTIQGGLIMAACVTLVMGLNIFCLYRLLRQPHPKEHHPPHLRSTRKTCNRRLSKTHTR